MHYGRDKIRPATSVMHNRARSSHISFMDIVGEIISLTFLATFNKNGTYAIIGILKTFWPITWLNINIFITINLHDICFYLLMWILWSTKPQKVHKIGHISVVNFYPIAVIKKVLHPTFFNVFA